MNDNSGRLEAQLAAATTVRARIDALNALAWEMRDLNPRGQAYAQEAHDLAQFEQYPRGIAESLVNQCQYIFSDFARALALGAQAQTIFEQLGDRTGLCRAIYTLCWAYWFGDDFVQSIETGRRGQKLAHEIGDRALEADLLNSLGLAYKRSGNYELAHKVYTESLALYRAIGDRSREGKVLANIALACVAQGEYDRALICAHEYQQLGIDNPRINGYLCLALGQVYAGKKAFDQALQYLHQAVSYANEHAEQEQLSVVALQTIGQIYAEQRAPGAALTHLRQALAIAEGIQSHLYAFRCHEILSQVYESQGDLAPALMHYKEFHAVKERVFNEENARRRQVLEIQHRTEIARREAEIYQLRNVELEREMAERERLEKVLEQQATTDELTGIFNRRHFLRLAHLEIERALRFKHPISVALIDLDHFKRINDLHGHAVGDLALSTVARTVQDNIRSMDVFARFGGDEFALLLPETDSATARLVIERVRLILSRRPLNLRGLGVTITVSAGISRLGGATDTMDALLTRADQALYGAKALGRDCIRVDEHIDTSPERHGNV
jgi:diguanylate cyclase (GGDEF)-like protein